MARNLLVIIGFWLAFVHFACRSSTSAMELSISVPENVAVGETIFTLPWTQAEEKAELPCAKTEGDPYDRFNVTENCTVWVANPLDWSVQSIYLLNIRHNASIKVELTDVEGYPPVYNETCETPINRKYRPGQILFSATVSGASMTTNAGLVVFKRTYSTIPQIWIYVTIEPWMLHTENSDCNIRIASYTAHPADLLTLDDAWRNGILDHLQCSAGSDLPTILIELISLKYDSESKLINLTKYVPEEIVFNRMNQFILLSSLTFPTKDAKTYHCEFPPFNFSTIRAREGSFLETFEYFDIQLKTIGCPGGKYGLLCDKHCICKNGARCHGFNGACRCLPGWKGVACDIPTREVSIAWSPSEPEHVYMSANLTFHCKAHHIDVRTMFFKFPNGTEKVSVGVRELNIMVPNIQSKDAGPYTCRVEDTQGDTFNTTFVLNITNCPPNRKGAQCDERCDCQHEASCDRWAGCVCPPGWTGTRCQTKCPHGTYGKDCGKDCICLNGASCGPIDGRCNCTGGWFGKDCSRSCPDSRYGWGCRQDCTCENNAKCDSKDGSCVCVSPWTGRNCDKYMNTYAPLLESLVPLGSLVLLVVIVTAILYKTGVLNCSVPDAGEEEKILFELRRMEQDLAQSLQPGWLGRWEKKVRHLTPGPLIGEGMFGKVRKAQLRTPKGELAVAAKTVRVEDSQSFRDFYREAAILVAVHQEQHDDVRQSNIVHLVGLITKSEEKYILLEYAPKGDLLGYLRGVRVNQEDLHGSLLTYAVHIARALQELARPKIAHRDVAARNVLITADDVAKLADFGLARDVYATTQYVRDNRPGLDELLPLKWMALESIETGQYTCQSDVWSFGVLLWEIATLGQDPCYDGRIQLSFLQMVGILRQGIRMTKPPGCPEDLYQLMRACWCDVPDTRPTPDGLEQYLSQLIQTLLPHEVIEMETTVCGEVAWTVARHSLRPRDKCQENMARNLLVIVGFWLAFVHFACSTSVMEFSVSVPENVAVGETIFTLPWTQAEEKAELPCAKMEGDPYDRFNVTENCTVWVANPLDWSVQSVYLLNIRHNARIKVELTDVEGYPPVYNETCETPINRKYRPGQILFSTTVSGASMTTNAGLVVFQRTYSTIPEIWIYVTIEPWMLHTENSDCNIRIASYTAHPADLLTLDDAWRNGILDQLQCSAGSDLPTILIDLISLKYDSESKLINLTKYVPEEVVFNRMNQFILLSSPTFPTKDAKTYHCEFPPFNFSTIRVGEGSSLETFEYFDIQLKPIGCPGGKYGLLCDKNCICKNGGRCHGFNGACRCLPGWKGVACDIPTREVSVTLSPSEPEHVYMSANLTFHCKAHHIDVRTMFFKFPNGTEEISVGVRELNIMVPNIQSKDAGPYTCKVEDTQGDTFNTTFVLNITNCPPNRKGAQCDERCDCQHEASCDRWAGCVCPPGWTGTRCQTKCPHGTYGKDCAKDCICLNGASCGPSNGRCNCTGGWFGKDCSRPCRDGRYGWGCRQDCTCENNAKCDSKDGSCVCVSPWTGRNCDKYMNTYAPLLESLVPLGSLVLLVVIVTAILYKTGVLNCSVPDIGEEEKILFELKKMEQDLAQSLQPGWLGRWEKKIRHLTPGPLIGEGMFGKVRKAQLRTPKGELAVAAKTVRLEDSQSFRDFYREAAILVAVHQERCDDVQSNIVHLVGLITKSEEKYILLEYAPKGDLLGYLRRPRADQEDLLGSLLTYAVHIARALQELERLRIAHRDVAARNVLITADNVAKLADFGLARDVYATTQYVRDNRPGLDELLPLKWMALESIETGEYTCQSDVWSFGVLLWEIATLGQDPCYDGRIQLSFLQMVGILRQGIRMTKPPGCPEDLYQLMRACWCDVPDTRPTPDGLEQYLSQLILTLLRQEVIEMETTV
ncbi:uncharacterized protein LOC144914628 [Branchiostoma floridae x Branchiostoma belcheri]